MAWPLEEVKQLTCADYTIAWICALPLEKAAARNMLDELHKTPPLPDFDSNFYTCGRVHGHNIVIVCQSDMGSVAAAAVANQLVNTFQRLQCGLLVGIAGGVPENRDIRLGDVVISRPDGRSGGVVAHDRGKWTLAGFEPRPYLNGVPQRLQNVFNELESLLIDHENRIMDYIQDAIRRNPRFQQFSRPEQDDYLFVRGYNHLSGGEGVGPCAPCLADKSMLVSRPPRGSPLPAVHFGGVASGNQLIKDGLVRSQIAERHPGVFALEMEAAGLMNVFGCATIRGICDYADSHKNDYWQKHAAAVASAVTKEILRIIPGTAKVTKPDTANALGMSSSAQESSPTIVELPHTAVPRAFIRRDELRWIEQGFAPNSLSQQTTIILYGPEGIGKTRLAMEYVAQHGSRYSEVFWVDGTTKDSVHRSIASFSTHLHAQADAYKISAANTAQSMQHAVNNVLAWFSQPSNTRWLLILDNVERYPGEEAYNILEYFPKARHGSILVTTRLAELANVGRGLPISPMNGEQGRHLLESVSRASVPDVERLVSALGGHPLALVLAGAYLGLHSGSLEDYMDMQHSPGKLIEASPSLSCQCLNYQFAWQVAFHQVSKDNLYATHLIELWACLSNTDMWFELLSPDLKNISQIPDWLYSVVSDRSLFLQSMQTLADHALIEHQKRDGCYTMHLALHEWCFDQLQNKEQMVLNAIVILGTATPGDEEPTLEQLAIEHRLSPHLDRIVSLLHYVPPAPDIPKAVQEILASCLYDIAETYRHQRRLGEAEQLFERAHHFYESAHGADHRETLRSLHILGWVYAEQDNLVRAEETYKRVLKGKASKYGPDHAFLSNTSLNLGNIYKKTNRVDEAEAMFKRALRGYETVLGPTNPATLDVTYSLGVLYCEQARTAEAEQMLLAAIQGYDANSGPGTGTGTGTEPEDADTLKAVNSLGCLYLQDPRRIHEAETLLKRALHGRERVLGLHAEDTLQTIQNLGVLYMFQTKNHEAERMYNRAWQGYESILGGSAAAERHVPALRVILGLAFLESCRMRMGKARELATRVLLAAQALEPSLDAAKLSQDALVVLTRLASL